MTTYVDPANINEIIDELKTLQTLGEVKDLVDRVFPGFIIGTIEEFSNDYKSIQENWHRVCSHTGVRPTEIMIVSDFFFRDNYTLARLFCETFTKAGFCVRKYTEYMKCVICGKAIATQDNHALLKRLGQRVPTGWNDKCSTC